MRTNPTTTPFHEGEQAIHERLGVRDAMAHWGRKVVRTWMPEQHREFYEQLPFVVAASPDNEGRPWVTLLAGKPGFVQSPSSTRLDFMTAIDKHDALAGSFLPGAEVGLLGIELESRRRNRVNGRIADVDEDTLRFDVRQAFGNCPQYITEREWHWVDRPEQHKRSSRHTELTPSMQEWIAGADTFFIGSGRQGDPNDESTGMDASHRGGPSGFVRVEGARRLVFPDYAGNNHFNTLGNLVLDPRVGLLFPDFESGDLLQISGTAEIDFDSPAIQTYPGALRLIAINVEDIVLQQNVLPLRFSQSSDIERKLLLVERRRESADVTSFYFTARDGTALPDFVAGQHLPVTVEIDGKPVSRSYSLSNGPGQGHYRISVKKEPYGQVSGYLHDEVPVGSVLKTSAPAGDFGLADSERPVVLISAGVGITPMMSLLHELTSHPSDRPVTFLHSARDGDHHPFAREINMIANQHPNVTPTIAFTQPTREDRERAEHDVEGRLDASLIQSRVGDISADYYLCGPGPFLGAMTDILGTLGVDDERIHTESF